MKAKETAVEFMIKNIIEDNIVKKSASEWEEIFNQAKQMEKEYLERFYNQGYTQCSIEDLKHTSRDRFVDAKDYYNKTFKSE